MSNVPVTEKAEILVRMPKEVAQAYHNLAAQECIRTGRSISKNSLYVRALQSYLKLSETRKTR